MAPPVGFEPTTKWLTAIYSTAELWRNIYLKDLLFLWVIFAFKYFIIKWKELYFFLIKCQHFWALFFLTKKITKEIVNFTEGKYLPLELVVLTGTPKKWLK